MACQSHHQGGNNTRVNDKCMWGFAYIAMGCSCIGSGENIKWINQMMEMGHDVIGPCKTEKGPEFIEQR
jgi:hypothetical protein